MAATSSLTIIKTFTYRGAAEEFSNTYHFNGGTPADAAAWKALADAVIAQEKTIHESDTVIVRAIGHKAGVTAADWIYDYAAHTASVPGTLAAGTGAMVPGDVAAWVRWSTTAKTSKGKPIFLRSYYHGMRNNGSSTSNRDLIQASTKTALLAYAAAWVTGFSDGTNTYTRAGPNGATGGTPVACTYLTTRTLERRGKRPRP
jgi:hypothetical protein